MDAATIARDLRRKLDGEAPAPAPTALALPDDPVQVEITKAPRPWSWRVTPVRDSDGLMVSAMIEPVEVKP